MTLSFPVIRHFHDEIIVEAVTTPAFETKDFYRIDFFIFRPTQLRVAKRLYISFKWLLRDDHLDLLRLY